MNSSKLFLSILFSLIAFLSMPVYSEAPRKPAIMSASDLANFPSPIAEFIVPYGHERLQIAELRLPDGPGPYPTMMLIHGGCWLSQYDLVHMRSLAAAFTREGFATWLIEYRRVGDQRGGWPGTFEDVAMAGEFLPEIATMYNLDLNRMIVAGHSAGGHLATAVSVLTSDKQDENPDFSALIYPVTTLGPENQEWLEKSLFHRNLAYED